ncbi:MAG: hypothetical protein SFU83_23980 [Meiothermus sp.]|nr:hypothetical protein [Meiothermus sp.]
MLRERNFAWLVSLVAVLAACAAPPATGRLEVTLEGVDGLSGAEWPGYKLTGPNYVRTFQNSASLPGREPGTYSLEAPPFEARGNRYAAQVRFGTALASSGVLDPNQTLSVRVAYTSTPVVVAPTTGTLSLAISGPGLEGFAPNVSVTGPDGFSQSITASGATALTGLTPGNYQVAASPVVVLGVSLAPPSSQVSQRVSVSAGQAAQAAVAYAATNSSVSVTLSGLEAGDQATVTLRGAAGAAITPQSRVGNGPVRFAGVPFDSYTVVATAIRPGSLIGLGSSEASVTTSLQQPLPSSIALALREQTGGQMYAIGNGSLRGGNGVYSLGFSEIRENATLTRLLVGDAVGLTDLAQSCFDTVSRSPFRAVFDPAGNLYLSYQGYSVGVGSLTGCTRLSYPGQTAVRGYYVQPFILKVSPDNLRQGRFFEITRENRPADEVSGSPYVVEVATPVPGNKVLRKSVVPTTAFSTLEDIFPFASSTRDREPGVEAADMAFDAQGNLWLVNKASAALACVAADQLAAPDEFLNYPNRTLRNPYADADANPATKPAGVSPLLYNAFDSPSALAFDRDGNLWFASDNYQFGDHKRSRLSRLPAASLTCPTGARTSQPAAEAVIPDVRLDISLSDRASPFYTPSDLALSPDGDSLWVSDSGGNDDIVLPTSSRGLCPRPTRTLTGSTTEVVCPAGADRLEETLIQVPIRNPDGSPHPNSTPNTASEPIKAAVVADRIAITSSGSVGTGALQEPYGLAFDGLGRLWVAANNNMNVTQALRDAAVEFAPSITGQYAYLTPRSVFSDALRDRRGKLYGLTLPTSPNPNPAQPRPVSSLITLSAETNTGLTSVGFLNP